MARKVEVTILDDIDGTEADGTVDFALDGIEYEIDLSKTNTEQLRSALAPFLTAARKAPAAARQRTPKRAPKAATHEGPSTSEVRAWAQQHGIEISGRGRIPADVYVKFEEARAS